MRKASTWLLEKVTQAPSPSPDLFPAETSTENLHWDWYNKRGHVCMTVGLIDGLSQLPSYLVCYEIATSTQVSLIK